MAITKLQALSVVFAAASDYQENLVDKSLLFVCMDKHKRVHCVEVTFDTSNFKHMTGFKTDIDALQFFDLCANRRLKEGDFEFSDDGTTPLKMQVLPRLVRSNLSANMIGDYNMSQPKLYTEKIAGSVSACIGFVRTRTSGRLVPNTVLEGDIRKRVNRPDRIILTYRKNRGDSEYSELVYQAKKVDWSKISIPEPYKNLPLPVIEKEEQSQEVIQAALAIENPQNEIGNAEQMAAIRNAIETYRDIEWSDEKIVEKLIQRFGLSEDAALGHVIEK